MTQPVQARFTPWALAAALLLLSAQAAAQRPAKPARPAAPSDESGRLVAEKTGTLATQDGQRLHLMTDLGSVRILTQNSGQVSYRARIETDRHQPDAERLLKQFEVSADATSDGVEIKGQITGRKFRGRLWVNFELNVPRNYQLDVLTHAGNIETEEIDGRVSLVTSGGNITAARVGGPARLETQGGHVTVQDVAGDLNAFTAGGHIQAGRVEGGAVLRSGGGHIKIVSVQGTAQLDTGGGNISVQRANGKVTATTGGGRIDFGEAASGIRAKTGGGGIRVWQVTGATEVETSGGGIYLRRILGSVKASTLAGGITAWFAPEGKLYRASELECGAGDIVVYLPRELPVTIEAIIEMGSEHSVDADPGFSLKVSYASSGPGPRVLRAESVLNGGGELLRLRTMVGKIKLRFSDSTPPPDERFVKPQD